LRWTNTKDETQNNESINLLFTNIKSPISCVFCYIMCFIVISVCTIVKLRHWVSLAPLFGIVYITVLNCVCYAMFIWWFVFYYMHCPVWHIICNPAFMQHTNKTIIIIIIFIIIIIIGHWTSGLALVLFTFYMFYECSFLLPNQINHYLAVGKTLP